MPSLSPRRNFRAHVPVLPDSAAFAWQSRARLPDLLFSRLPLRSLSLRPGCLLAVLATASSTGFRRSIARPPAVRATRLSAFVMVGLLSNWMHLPCLDARLPIKKEGKRGPLSGCGITLGLAAGCASEAPLGPENGCRHAAAKPLRGWILSVVWHHQRPDEEVRTFRCV